MAARKQIHTTTASEAQGEDYSLAEVVKQLADLLDRKIAYQPDFARIGGCAAAGVFLSQLFYWTQGKTAQGRVIDGRRGWVYKSMRDWWDEAGLHRKDWRDARKHLLARGLIEESRRGERGTMVYRIVLRRFVNLLIGREVYEKAYEPGVVRRMSNFGRGAECRKSTVCNVESPQSASVDFPQSKNVESPQSHIQEITEQKITTGDYAREEGLADADARALTELDAVLYYKYLCALVWGAKSVKARRLLGGAQKAQAVATITYMVGAGYDLSLIPAYKKKWDKSWMSRKATEPPTLAQVRELWVQMTGDSGGEVDVDLEGGGDGGQHQEVAGRKRTGGLRGARNE